MVVRNKRAVRQAIKLGLRGDNQVEVLSGLKTGETLLLASIGTIKPNQRVRINKNSVTASDE
jgi:HlyD family secretion protein